MPIDWSIKGPSIVACNCDWGCPCQFNALPTYGDCRATLGMRIDEGHFGDIDLSGQKIAVLVAWPKAIHEGHGQALPIVDKKADERQREALLKIMSGEETEPGATFFNVFASTYDTVHPPRFEDIEFEADIEGRVGRIRVPGLVSAQVAPIRNPVNGAEHRARIALPQGFEYTEAEVASGTVEAQGIIPLQWENRHSHMSTLHLTPTGPVR
jgi:hypothetical protein